MDVARLKLAVQKAGRLTDPSLDLLVRCGLKLSRGKDQLIGFGENMPLDVLFVRDDDIPDLVQEDVCDLGLVGLNVLEEKRLELTARGQAPRSEEHTSELQSQSNLVCRLLLEKKKKLRRAHQQGADLHGFFLSRREQHQYLPRDAPRFRTCLELQRLVMCCPLTFNQLYVVSVC